MKVAGELRQAIRRGAPDEVLSAYRGQLATDRAEKALAKVLADAPPLTPSQVAHLRAVLTAYGSDDDAGGE